MPFTNLRILWKIGQPKPFCSAKCIFDFSPPILLQGLIPRIGGAAFRTLKLAVMSIGFSNVWLLPRGGPPFTEQPPVGPCQCCAGIRICYRYLLIIILKIYPLTQEGYKFFFFKFGIEPWFSMHLKISQKPAFLTVKSLVVLS